MVQKSNNEGGRSPASQGQVAAPSEQSQQAVSGKADILNAGLDFGVLRSINVARCVEAFNHNLDDWSLSDWFTATMGELGEAANIAKKLNRIRDGVDSANAEHETQAYLQGELADEIADTLIYLDLLAASQGVDLGLAVARKFNKTSVKLGAPHRIPEVGASA